MKLVDCFWDFVEPEGECLVWTRGCTGDGYGKVTTNKRGEPRAVEHTHRWVYKQLVGPIPDGMHVLHHCDNPPCVRLDHLFLGTNLDNVLDRVAKGRSNRTSTTFGEDHPNAKVAVEDVKEIRRRAAAGESYWAIAKDYPITVGPVQRIAARETWRHVA